MKSRMSGTCARTLLAAMRSAAVSPRMQALGRRFAEERYLSRDPFFARHLGNIRRRLHTEHRHPSGEKIL